MPKKRIYGFNNKVRKIKSGERIFKIGYNYFTIEGFRVRIDKITMPEKGEMFIRCHGWKNELVIEIAKHPFHKPRWKNSGKKKHYYLIVDDYVYSD